MKFFNNCACVCVRVRGFCKKIQILDNSHFVQLFNEMRKRNQKYGAVSMCVGTGQGAAGIFELL